MDAADGRDAPLERIVGAALEADRAGLGHAVGDRDLAHVHLARRTRFITSIGQGEPAMMPVRSDREVEPRELGMVELGDEHGRHAVAARCSAPPATASQRRQRIEALAGIDHRRAVGDAGEVAEHHAEAVIERHRDAEPVVLGEAHRLADEVAVVEDVVVGQRRALRERRWCRR